MKLRARATATSLLLVLALAPAMLQAKSGGRILGRISGLSGEGLIGAIVTLFKQDQNGGTISFTRSDKTGSFSLANLAPGTYYLQVSRDGYQPLTSSNIQISSGRTTTINVVMQQFIDLISSEPDPRNWGMKSVLRSTYDRRMIFRSLPTEPPEMRETDGAFQRGSALTLTSSTGLGSENYSVFPSRGENGITSNFAFVEPVSDHGRLIFAGQLNTGYDTWWRVRNTYQLRPDSSRDYKLSLGYAQLMPNTRSIGSMSRPGDFFNQDPSTREQGVRSLALGFEARNNFFDLLDLRYGFDASQVQYGTTRSFISPYIQIVVTPVPGWMVRTATMSRRMSDNAALTLADGEVLNLSEPTFITRVNGDVHLSQHRHSELGLMRTLADDSAMEVSVYEDHMHGPGLPFMVASSSPRLEPFRLLQPRQDQTRQRGVRISLNRRIAEAINGSIAYVYGSGSNLSDMDHKLSREALANHLLDHMQRSYYHALTGQLSTLVPRTNTHLAAVVRWYPGYTLSPIDLFADRADIFTKGINFSLRQPVPLPEFMGSAGRWEVLVDVRNLLDDGHYSISARDGKLLLYNNPRTLRFGINLNFY